MEAVYGNAALTINGPAASCTDDTLFRSAEILGSCEIPVGWSEDRPRGTAIVTFETQDRSIVAEESDSPLNTRAWVAQEFLLSQRVLSLGSVHTYLTCNQHVMFDAVTFPVLQGEYSGNTFEGPMERPHLQKSLLTDLRRATDASEAHVLWYKLLAFYTERSLTYGDDKLPAIQGIAQHFVRSLPSDRYVAGLWANDMVRGLAWSREPERYRKTPQVHPRTQHIPTWSWASLDHRIEHINAFGSDEVWFPLVEIIGLAQQISKGGNADLWEDTGLTLSGRTIGVRLGGDPPAYKSRTGHYLALSSIHPFNMEWKADHGTTSVRPIANPDSLVLFLSLQMSSNWILNALVIEPVVGKANVFKRAGIACDDFAFPCGEWADVDDFVRWARLTSEWNTIKLV